MTDMQERVRDNRLRRQAARRGLLIQKSRIRDAGALGFGQYQILDPKSGDVLAGGDFRDGAGLSADEAERWLLDHPRGELK